MGTKHPDSIACYILLWLITSRKSYYIDRNYQFIEMIKKLDLIFKAVPF